ATTMTAVMTVTAMTAATAVTAVTAATAASVTAATDDVHPTHDYTAAVPTIAPKNGTPLSLRPMYVTTTTTSIAVCAVSKRTNVSIALVANMSPGTSPLCENCDRLPILMSFTIQSAAPPLVPAFEI